MTTATTTLEAIRDNMAAILESLTPVTAPEVRFRRDRGESEFMAWAEGHPSAAFRRYSIDRTGGGAPLPVSSNGDVEERRERILVRIAYPRANGLYRQSGNPSDGVRDSSDVMEEDRELIIGRSGVGALNAADYIADAQHASNLIEDSVEEGEAVRFAEFLFEVHYYREIAA